MRGRRRIAPRTVANMTESQPQPEKTDAAPDVEGAVQGREALANAVAALLRSARREVRLFAPCIEPAVFHTPPVTSAIAHFAAAHSRNRVNVLIEDVAQVMRENGRLIELARRLADNVELREVEDNDRGARDLFLLVDRSAFLTLEDIGRSDGVVSARAPQELAQLITRFDDVWERATPVALRTLGL
jgi:sugar-specific transcriptional regulator TrmB